MKLTTAVLRTPGCGSRRSLLLPAIVAAVIAVALPARQVGATAIDVTTGCTINEAVATAQAAIIGNPDPMLGCTRRNDGLATFTVFVPAGTFTVSPTITIIASLIITGAGQNSTTLVSSDPGPSTRGRAFTVQGSPTRNPRLILKNLTIRSGFTPQSGIGVFIGPAPASAALLNVHVTNYVTGLRVDSPVGGAAAEATVQENCLFDGNLQSGIVTNNSTLALNNSRLNGHGDSAIRAIINDPTRTITIFQTTFQNNSSADSGGAIFFSLESTNRDLLAPLAILSSTFTNNTTTGNGGALFIRGRATVNQSTFTGNRAGFNGGASHIAFNDFGSSNLAVDHTTYDGNTAPVGGALSFDGQNGTSVQGQILRCLFTNNGTTNTTTKGGAIFSTGQIEVDVSTIHNNRARQGAGIYHDGQELHLRHATIAANTATEKGGGVLVRFNSNALIASNIIAGNSGPNNGFPDWGFIVNSHTNDHEFDGFNLVQNVVGIGATFPGIADGATNVTGVSAGLSGTLQNLGGSTRVLALNPGSPAIDAIPLDVESPSLDQRDIATPKNGNDAAPGGPRDGFDIGAFEAGENQALTATASASSQSSAARAAAMARDKNAGTRWEAANGTSGQFLRMSFAAATTVSNVTLREFGSRITNFRIERLQNGAFTTVVSGTTIGTTPKLIPFNAVSTTALRVFVVSSNGSPSLAEFEIY